MAIFSCIKEFFIFSFIPMGICNRFVKCIEPIMIKHIELPIEKWTYIKFRLNDIQLIYYLLDRGILEGNYDWSYNLTERGIRFYRYFKKL